MASTQGNKKTRNAGNAGGKATDGGQNSKGKSKGGGLTYAQSGVDLETYDTFIGSIGSMIRRTHSPRVIDNEGGFAGLFRLDYNEKLFKRNYRDPVLVACCDGVGTKIKLAAAMNTFDTVGIDLVAMSINDLVVQGAEPLFFLDYIAVPGVNEQQLNALVHGVSEGCRIADCALLGGETAEMPSLYAKGEFDMAGFAVGVVELKRAINPMRMEPGDIVLGLASSGVHSNGYSLVRKVVEHAKLDLNKHYAALEEDRPLGEILLEPTRIYSPSIIKLLRTYKVKNVVSGMAHITGGGLAQNLERSLPKTVDVVIERKKWEVPPVFRFLQEQGRIDEEEMRRVFNMGIGYTLVVRPTFADAVMEKLIKSGERVVRIGRVTKGKGVVKEKK